MRIVTARSPSASPSRSSSPSSSKKRPPASKRWRRVDCVISFPSSKRVQGTPRANYPSAHSHHSAPPYQSAATPSHFRHRASSNSQQRSFQDRVATSQDSPKPKGKRSVWQRISDRASSAQSLRCEDLEVCATTIINCNLNHLSRDIPKENRIDDESKSTQMDIDPQAGVYDTKGALEVKKNSAIVDVSHKFAVKAPPTGTKEIPLETDPHKLNQRQKQIDYGKNTLGYERYLELVPRNQRKRCHPQTPNIKQICSKRSWDGQVKKWRRLLHEFDPPANDDDESPELFSLGGGVNANDSAEEQDAKDMAVDSEGTPTGNDGVGTIYDDWDAMEP